MDDPEVKNRLPEEEVQEMMMDFEDFDTFLSRTVQEHWRQQPEREDPWVRVVRGEFQDELGQLISRCRTEKVTVRLLPRVFVPDSSEMVDPHSARYYQNGEFLTVEMPLDHVRFENVQPTDAELERFKEVCLGDNYVPTSTHSFKAGDLVCEKHRPFNHIFQVEKIRRNEISIYPRGGDKNNLETKSASALRKTLDEGDHALVLSGIHAGNVGQVQKINTYFTVISDSVDMKVLPEDLKYVHPWCGRRVHVVGQNINIFGYVEDNSDRIPLNTGECSYFEVKNETTGEIGWYDTNCVTLARNFGSDSENTLDESASDSDPDSDADSDPDSDHEDILFLPENSTINHYMYGKEVVCTCTGIRGVVRDVRQVSSKTTLVNVISNNDYNDQGSWINENMLHLTHLDEENDHTVPDVAAVERLSVGHKSLSENLTQESIRFGNLSVDSQTTEENDNHRNSSLVNSTPSTSSGPGNTCTSGKKRKSSSRTSSDNSKYKKKVRKSMLKRSEQSLEEEDFEISNEDREIISATSADSSERIVDCLLQYKKTGVHTEWARKAIDKLVAKLEDNDKGMDDLIDCVSNQGPESSPCIIFKADQNGKIYVGGDYYYPQPVSAQIWRWDDLEIAKTAITNVKSCSVDMNKKASIRASIPIISNE